MKQIFCAVCQNPHGGGQLREKIIRQFCRHLGSGSEGIGHNRVHRRPGNLDNGLLLPQICLRCEFFQVHRLINDYRGIGRHQQKNGNQHHIENFLLNASDYQILVFLHKDSFSAPVSPAACSRC